MDFSTKLLQTMTYWAPGTPDGYGRVLFEAVPVEIQCRWQNVAELFRDTKGNEVVSRAVIYTLDALEVGGWVVFGSAEAGTVSDPRTVSGAEEIRQIGTSPSLRATQLLYKVMV